MRKNRFLIFIALVLVCAMLAVTVVGCQKTENTPSDNTGIVDTGNNGGDNEGNGGNTSAGNGGWSQDGNGGSTSTGTTYAITDADAYISFDVKADSASDISVTNATGGKVNVEIKENNGVYTVWAPTGGYEKGRVYKITLSNGATFVNYEGVSVITFNIGNSANNIKINSGFLTYSENAVTVWGTEKTDGYGVTTGTMNLQTNATQPMAAGTIFLIEKNEGTQSAYKVTRAQSSNNGLFFIEYEKPDFSEVFEEFEYSATSKLTEDSDVQFEMDETVEALKNSELMMGLSTSLGKMPEISATTPSFEDGKIVFDIVITFKDIVTVDGYAGSDLVITVHNVMEVQASANIDKETVAEEFSLNATVKNDVTTTVTLGADGGYTGIASVTDLMNKLIEYANENKDDATAIPLLKWTVPIANGVASITYDADLIFRFNVAGEVNASAHAQLDYKVGVMYTKADGIEAYAQELDGNGIDSVQVDLGGQAELKIGLRQGLSFDVLAGVLGVGIEAEIGNYNRLYGYGESSNLIDDADDYFVGGVYFEGGFYYDIDLTYGLKIGSLLNLSDKADIVAGEIKGYELGNRYLVLGVGATAERYTLSALNTNIPSIYYKDMYDLVTKQEYREVAAAEEFVYTSEKPNDLAVENNVIKVTKTIADTNVTATYAANEDLSVTVAYNFSLAAPVLDNDTLTVNKGSYKNINEKITFGVNYDGFANEGVTVESEDVTVIEVEKKGNRAVVSVPVKELLAMDNGMNKVNLAVDGKTVVLNLDVEGKVSWNQFATGANDYSVFTADQIVDMVNSNASFDNAVITIENDIDMKGAELAPIAVFNGTLQGNGKMISNYTVKAFSGEKAGFIAVNKGTIDNVVFAGNVDVALEATTGKDYAVAGIAAVNEGTIKNCAYTGNVSVYSYGLAAFVDFDVAAISATNSGTLTDNKGAEVPTSVKVTVKFDLLNVNVNIGDTTSTSNDIAGIVESIKCENGVSGGPWATKCNIK